LKKIFIHINYWNFLEPQLQMTLYDR